jgi:hypothetical protein
MNLFPIGGSETEVGGSGHARHYSRLASGSTRFLNGQRPADRGDDASQDFNSSAISAATAAAARPVKPARKTAPIPVTRAFTLFPELWFRLVDQFLVLVLLM